LDLQGIWKLFRNPSFSISDIEVLLLEIKDSDRAKRSSLYDCECSMRNNRNTV